MFLIFSNVSNLGYLSTIFLTQYKISVSIGRAWSSSKTLSPKIAGSSKVYYTFVFFSGPILLRLFKQCYAT